MFFSGKSVMELSDAHFTCNRDWDPSYLKSIFDTDFYEYSDLWSNSMDDSEILDVATFGEPYQPIVISMDDNELCSAVEKIESE